MGSGTPGNAPKAMYADEPQLLTQQQWFYKPCLEQNQAACWEIRTAGQFKSRMALLGGHNDSRHAYTDHD